MLAEQTTIAPPHRPSAATIHRIEIERTHWTQTGARYRVSHRGNVLVESVRDPEHEACRALLAMGITGTLETYFPGGTVARMRLDIEKCAKLSVVDSATHGTHTRKWRPFGAEGEDGDAE